MKNLILVFIAAIFINSSIAQPTAINENFEIWPAADWNIYQLGQGGNWLHSSAYGPNLGYGGGNCAKIQISNDPADNWLVSPQVSVITNDYELVFYEKNKDLQYYGYSGVYISTGSGIPADNDFVAVSESIQVEDAWVEHIVDLSSYNGEDIYVAFVYQGTWTHWNVDEVVISPSTLIDGALNEIVNPIGINPIPGSEDVIVNLHNYGTDPIVDIDIEWRVNGVPQATYSGTGLNLTPGDNINITVGQYNFATQDDYVISLNHLLVGDANPSNDSVESTYYVSDPKDAAITAISPEGYSPITGVKDVIVTVLNNGDFTINDATIQWNIDGIIQTDYIATSINLDAGESVDLTVGQYDFIDGLTEINCTVIISADEDLSNNSGVAFTAVNIIWESFETDVFPPEMWIADDYPLRDTFWTPPHGKAYYTSETDNNYFGSISDTLWTPLLDIENGDNITFWVNNSGFFTNDDKLIYKDGTSGAIFNIQDIDSQLEQWDEVTIDISSAAGVNYIGFVNDNFGGYGISKIDKITSTASIYHFNNDLGIRDIEFEYLAKINEPHTFNVNIRNYGFNTVQGSSYSVKIVNDLDVIIAEETGVTLQSWEEVDIEIYHTFTELENLNIRAIIDYTNDQMNDNDISVEYPVYAVPADVTINDIGYAEVRNPMIPFNTGGDTYTIGEDDLSQHIYYQDELNFEGYLYGVTLYYNEMYGVGQDLPLEVRLTETNLVDLTGGWIPQDEMMIVFSDTITVYPGDNSVYIPFDEPFLITGTSNIAIQYFQFDPSWPATACRFYSTSDNGPVRGIRVSDYYNLDPSDPPTLWASHTDYSYASFVYQPIDGEGIISGTVFDENNDTIQYATITVEGTSIVESTGETGIYTLPGLPYETYEITASYYGYNDSTKTIVLNEPNETLDFNLTPLPEVSVSGEVRGSNNPDIPLEGVLVTLYADNVLTTYTDASGEFLFETVYGNNEYEITFEIYGYHNYSDTLIIEDADIDMGIVIMQEEMVSAYNVWAIPEDAQAIVRWEEPATSKKVKYQNDNGAESFSYTNEPYEEVMLGNRFENADPITITSVEILWDIYENAHDFITVDILDNDGNLLVSSEPVLTYNDSLMKIDVPNISIQGDFYAMVHWKDNAESTDALTIDYSDNVPNTAYIKYPGEYPILLNEFIGGDNGSFFVRVNTLEENTGKQSREVLSYNIYRGLVNEISSADIWTALNTEPLTELTYIDNTWTNNDPQTYTYAVEAIYTEGDAEFTFSNFIAGFTGIDDNEQEDVVIYPNPASTSLNLSGVEGNSISLYNIVGELLFTNYIETSTTQIDVSRFENGVYFIRIEGKNKQLVKKLIVSK